MRDRFGPSRPNVSAYVYEHDTTDEVALYADEAGSVALTQPLTTDSEGRFTADSAGHTFSVAWLTPGLYDKYVPSDRVHPTLPVVVTGRFAGAMNFKGGWNASTNTPTLVNGSGEAGDVYRVTVAGSHDFGAGSKDLDIGDEVYYDGSMWQKDSGANALSLSPTSSARNLIQPGVDGARGLTLKGHSTSQSADLLQLQKSDGTPYGGWDAAGRFYTATPAANTMLAGGLPLHVNPAGSPGVKVTPQGDVLFGTNELIHGGSISTSSASWDYQQSAFDGLYSALNKRWYMRSLIMAEVGDPPDLILGRYGPNNNYPMGATGDGSGLTGVGTNTSLGKLSFRGGKVPAGGTADVTGNSQMSGSVVAIYGRAGEVLTDTTQGGHLIFQTTPLGTVALADVARFNANGSFELGGNWDVGLKRESAGVLAIRTLADAGYGDVKANNLTAAAAATIGTTLGVTGNMTGSGAAGLVLNNNTTGTLLFVGGVSNANRWAKIGGDGKLTIRSDDNAVDRVILMENSGITAADQGVSIGALFEAGNINPIDAGSIRFASEDTWAAPTNKDSYIAFRNATDGVVAEKMRLTSAGNLNLVGNPNFNGVTGVARSTGWSVSNVTPDKSFDADATSIDELADVVGTLITYLLSRGDLAA